MAFLQMQGTGTLWRLKSFTPGNQVGLLDIAHTAKLQQVTQLLKSLEKDLQENNLSTAGKSDAIALILYTRLMLIPIYY